MSMNNLLSYTRLKGTMQFPLAGSQNQKDFFKEAKFTHDFKYQFNRKLIFSKPRVYKFFIGLSDTSGHVFDETEYEVNEPLTKDELTQVIKQMSHELINEYLDNQEIDLTQSYVRIELCSTN